MIMLCPMVVVPQAELPHHEARELAQAAGMKKAAEAFGDLSLYDWATGATKEVVEVEEEGEDVE